MGAEELGEYVGPGVVGNVGLVEGAAVWGAGVGDAVGV